MRKIKIGVLGCANVAKNMFIPAMKELCNHFDLVAVASRGTNKAIEFADEFNCEAVIGYEQLIARSDIEALYIPLPAGLHKTWTKKALLSGKHVYAEKSIGLHFWDVDKLVRIATNNNLALMEGFMYKYHSQHERLKKEIAKSTIGEIRYFQSSFCFPPLEKNNFRYNTNLGGGALFDAGAYPISAAQFILDENIHHIGSVLKRDENDTIICGQSLLKTDSNIGIAINYGFDNYYQCNYQILGTKGKITLHKAFTPRANEIPTMTLEKDNQVVSIDLVVDNQYQNSLIEFHNLITNNSKKTRQYRAILDQSKLLEQINSFK